MHGNVCTQLKRCDGRSVTNKPVRYYYSVKSKLQRIKKVLPGSVSVYSVSKFGDDNYSFILL